MDKEHISDLLPDYLDNNLDKWQKAKVEEHIKKCEACNLECNEYQNLIKTIKNEEDYIPSDALRANFLKQLEFEKSKYSKPVHLINLKKVKAFTRVAASILIIAGSFFLGYYFHNHLQGSNMTMSRAELKQTTILSLIGNKSASKRIQGVYFIEEFDKPDETIIKALIERMINDENTNVRRTAVDVLGKFIISDTVKESFIKALKSERDPGIQIALIKLLGEVQERKVMKSMQNLLQHEETQSYVKDELEAVLTKII